MRVGGWLGRAGERGRSGGCSGWTGGGWGRRKGDFDSLDVKVHIMIFGFGGYFLAEEFGVKGGI